MPYLLTETSSSRLATVFFSQPRTVAWSLYGSFSALSDSTVSPLSLRTILWQRSPSELRAPGGANSLRKQLVQGCSFSSRLMLRQVIESRKISGLRRGSRTEGSYPPFSIITISNFNCSIISFLSNPTVCSFSVNAADSGPVAKPLLILSGFGSGVCPRLHVNRITDCRGLLQDIQQPRPTRGSDANWTKSVGFAVGNSE